MLINYRHYTTTAMVDMLTREGVYFSRGNFVDQGRLHRPDTISLRTATGIGGVRPSLVVDCEVFNNLESIGGLLDARGFAKDEAEGRHHKQRMLTFQHKADAGKLVDGVMAVLNEAAEEMPLMLYASPAQKALADYHAFMTADIAKVSYGDVMRHLGYWDECDRPEPAVDAGAGVDYMIAKYKRGRWAAWASGDLIVPLFATEREAKQFLEQRGRRVCQQRPAVRTIAPVNRSCLPNVYVLVDHTKNVAERVAWLRCELDRLAGQGEMVVS